MDSHKDAKEHAPRGRLAKILRDRRNLPISESKAVEILGEAYLKEWQKSYPPFEDVISYFNILERAAKGAARTDQENSLYRMRERLLTMLVINHLSKLITDLNQSTELTRDRYGTRDLLLNSTEELFKHLKTIISRDLNNKRQFNDQREIKDGAGMKALGDLYSKLGDSRAFIAYLRSAELGSADACLAVAQCYKSGYIGWQDDSRYDPLYYPVARSKLAEVYENLHNIRLSMQASEHAFAESDSLVDEKQQAAAQKKFFEAVSHWKDAVKIGRIEKEVKPPPSLFKNIKEARIFDLIMLANDNDIGSIIKSNDDALDAIEFWCANAVTSKIMRDHADHCIHQILMAAYAKPDNPLAQHLKKELYKTLELKSDYAKTEFDKENAKKWLELFKQKDAAFRSAVEQKTAPKSKVAEPSTQSWKARFFSFISKKKRDSAVVQEAVTKTMNHPRSGRK